jgi:uncharacterized membrane protein YkoI
MLHSLFRNPLAVAMAMQLVFALAAAPAAGDDDGCAGGEYESKHDHERARRALECGEVMPLADVLAAVRPHISGRLIETEFEREEGLWVYELTYIDPQGHLLEIYVDAGTGRILKSGEGE